jgi:ribosomal protein L11 methyltransferase
MKTRKVAAQAPVASKAAGDGSPPAGSRTVPVQDSGGETPPEPAAATAALQKRLKPGPIWKVSVLTTPEAEDAVTEQLQETFGAPASSYTDVETGEVTVAVYLPQRTAPVPGRSNVNNQAGISSSCVPSLKSALRKIADCGLEVGPGKISMQRVRREDWAESWKRHFKPLEIGSALLIKPSWSKRRAKKSQAVVVLDPGLSFGTGQHPTTAFCLQQISSFVIRHSSLPSFLDIGTGSGILAIAAAKLGYSPVKAFDFDPGAVRIAQENARKNGVSRKVNIRHQDVTKLPARSLAKFDLICANLISTLLIAERRRILSRLKKGGVLVLAGILKSEFASVQRAYEELGMRSIASRTEKEWRSGAFQSRK